MICRFERLSVFILRIYYIGLENPCRLRIPCPEPLAQNPKPRTPCPESLAQNILLSLFADVTVTVLPLILPSKQRGPNPPHGLASELRLHRMYPRLTYCLYATVYNSEERINALPSHMLGIHLDVKFFIVIVNMQTLWIRSYLLLLKFTVKNAFHSQQITFCETSRQCQLYYDDKKINHCVFVS